MHRTSRTLLAACLLALLPAARAQPLPNGGDGRMPLAPLHEEVVRLPGDPARPASLEVTLFTPDGPGPFPLAVVNHGATDASASNRGDRYRYTVAAYYFLSRGYAVALPMMRGFSQSDGSIVHAGCDLAAVAQSNGRDIRAVIEAVGRRPGIDGSRVVVAGQSFGAWNALGLGTAPPAGVRGLVLFNPALRASDCASQDAAMAASAGQMAARTALPSLWFYGDNDTVMPRPAWRAVFDRYHAANARAELVAFGRYGDDSHQILSDPGSLPVWSPKVDAFLARIGLPSAPVLPEYLPHPVPPPTHFADLNDVAAVPYLTEAGRVLYGRFLQAHKPRAVAIAPNGAAAQDNGGYDPAGLALRNCARSSTQCQLYAVNDDVVWPGPARSAAAPVRTVSRTVRAGARTALGAFFSINPDCTSRALPRIAVAEAPAHGRVDVAPQEEHPAYAPNTPFAVCNAVSVPAVGVTYTPAPGFSGTDALTIERTDADGTRQAIHIDLRVMQAADARPATP